MLKPTFSLENLMKKVCIILGYENHHIFQQFMKKNSIFSLLKPIGYPT